MLVLHSIYSRIKKFLAGCLRRELTSVREQPDNSTTTPFVAAPLDWKTQGQELRNCGQFNDALNFYDRVLDKEFPNFLCDESLEIHLEKVKTYSEMLRPDVAIDYAKQTILNKKEYPKIVSQAYFQIGLIYQKQENFVNAWEAFRDSNRYDSNKRAQQKIQAIRKLLSPEPDDKPEQTSNKLERPVTKEHKITGFGGQSKPNIARKDGFFPPSNRPLLLPGSPENPLNGSHRFIFKCSLPKEGYSLKECEDKSAVNTDLDLTKTIKVAIADGVSQASFSGVWAELLVNNFIKVNQSINLEKSDMNWLETSQQQWQNWLNKQQLSWFAQRKLKVDGGSYSTFLGLRIYQEYQQYKWEALGIGDSCLFVVENGQLVQSFPCNNSSQLSGIPSQICTSSTADFLKQKALFDQGIIRAKTHFYLVTDALAGWIFDTLEQHQNPWLTLNKFTDANYKNFEPWVKQLRQDRKIRDDDTTLVHLEII